MGTFAYATDNSLPTVSDPESFPDRLRQTSLPNRSTQPGGAGGKPLTAIIDAGEIGADAAVDLFARICEAVQALHKKGGHHGRLTPRHITLVPNLSGEVQLAVPDAVAKDPGYDVLYESPEAGGQVKVRKRNPQREDVYSLGCIGFELFTGRAPFVGASPAEVRKRRASYAVPAARQVAADAELLPAVEMQIQKALKKRPGDRPANAGTLAAALRHANATDDRSTMALGDEQAELLKELLASKTANVEASKQLQEEKKRLEAEREKAAAEKARAAKEKEKAEAERKRAAEQAAQAAEAARKAQEAAEEAQSKGNTGLVIAVVALLLGGGGLGAFFMLGGDDAPAPAASADVSVAQPDTTQPEPDTAEADTGEPDTGPADTGPADTGQPDTGQPDTAEPDTAPPPKVKPKRRPKPKPKPKPRPKPKPKPKPSGGPVVF